jgi:hypothetical protein
LQKLDRRTPRRIRARRNHQVDHKDADETANTTEVTVSHEAADEVLIDSQALVNVLKLKQIS